MLARSWEGSALLIKGVRITGKDREKLTEKVKRQYAKGSGIRTIASAHGRSYGFIHMLLVEGGVEIRPRGGRNRTSANARARS